jgi:dihydroorotate dehydrogenase electron transfer subunit
MSCSAPPATHALSASYYADQAVWQRAEIVAHESLARETYRLRIRAPEIARRIKPGQFVMLRLAGFDDPLLGRALALFDIATNAAGEPTDLEVVYMVFGKLTRRLTAFQPGQQLEVWGPLGNGFPRIATNHLIMVAGGVGITPFLAVSKMYREVGGWTSKVGNALPEAQSLPPNPESRIPNPFPNLQPPTSPPRLTLCYGARTADYFAALDQFEQAGVEIRLSTDDGSRGHYGRVTEVLEKVLSEAKRAATPSSVDTTPPNPESRIPNPTASPQSPAPSPCSVFCCGPEPMMQAAAKVCLDANVPCYVSLETPMACGIGICFTCVAKVLQADGEWDYKRTCVEGPIFDARRIVWH